MFSSKFTAVVAATFLIVGPAFAQTSATPTGKADTTPSGMEKSGDAKSGGTSDMTPGSSMTNGATNGTSTLAGPAGKMENPASK